MSSNEYLNKGPETGKEMAPIVKKQMSLEQIQALRVDASSKKSSDTSLMKLARESALDVKGMTREERIAFVGEQIEADLTKEKNAAVKVILDNFLYNRYMELGDKDSVLLNSEDVDKLIQDDPKTFAKLALRNLPADFGITAGSIVSGLIVGGVGGAVFDIPNMKELMGFGTPVGLAITSAYNKKKQIQSANDKFFDKYQTEINRIANSETPEI